MAGFSLVHTSLILVNSTPLSLINPTPLDLTCWESSDLLPSCFPEYALKYHSRAHAMCFTIPISFSSSLSQKTTRFFSFGACNWFEAMWWSSGKWRICRTYTVPGNLVLNLPYTPSSPFLWWHHRASIWEGNATELMAPYFLSYQRG